MSFSSDERRRALLVIASISSILTLLTGCGATGSAATISPDVLADRVSARVERTLDLTAAVDCGAAEIVLADDTDVECRITDPETGETYDATVRIIAPEGAEYDIDLSVHQRAS